MDESRPSTSTPSKDGPRKRGRGSESSPEADSISKKGCVPPVGDNAVNVSSASQDSSFTILSSVSSVAVHPSGDVVSTVPGEAEDACSGGWTEKTSSRRTAKVADAKVYPKRQHPIFVRPGKVPQKDPTLVTVFFKSAQSGSLLSKVSRSKLNHELCGILMRSRPGFHFSSGMLCVDFSPENLSPVLSVTEVAGIPVSVFIAPVVSGVEGTIRYPFNGTVADVNASYADGEGIRALADVRQIGTTRCFVHRFEGLKLST